MKKRFLFISIITSLGLIFSLGSVFTNKQKIDANAIGSYSTNSSTYYSGITATSGKQLAAQLHDLITSTHQYYSSYADNGGNGYQQNTDQYYEGNSKISGRITEFYSGVSWPNAWAPNNGDTTGGYNREHCWCQSNSVNANGNQMWGESGGGADMHHLRPVECRLNSSRNNNKYGLISGDRENYKTYAKFGTNTTYALGGYVDSSNDTFEPLDSKKGDVARIIFYVYLHYNSYTVSDLFGSYGTTNGSGSSSYFSTSLLSLTKTIKKSTEAQAKALLLDWNASDPVDDSERRRNEQVAIYQGNRNPFIDNSNYAEMIWGTGTGTPTVNSVTVSPSTLNLTLGSNNTGSLTANVSVSNGASQAVTWTSSNTNVATVSSNGLVTAVSAGNATITATSTFNSSKSGSCTVTVSNPVQEKTLSSISISGQKTSFNVGNSFSFGGTVTAHFSDSTFSDVTSSATFTGYNMSTAGNQTVTVSYTYSGTTKTTTYQITVNSQSSQTTTGSYTIGWGFASEDDGDYSNYTATSGTVSNLFSFSCTKNGAQTTPAYNSSNKELRLYYSQTTGNGNSLTVVPEEGVTLTGFVMTVSQSATLEYSVDDGSAISVEVSNSKYTATNFEATESLVLHNVSTTKQLRVTKLTIMYETDDDNEKVIGSLSATYAGNVVVGGELNASNLSVYAIYTDSTTYPNALLDSSCYSLTGFSSNTSGNKNVTVTYTGSESTLTNPLTTTFTVTVIQDFVSSVSVTCSKTYHPGDTILKSDLTVTLSYSSGITNTTTNFEFASNGYQFTYNHAASGGSATSKQFSINYAGNPHNFSVNVSRIPYQTVEEITNVLSSNEFHSSNLSTSNKTPSDSLVTIDGVDFTVTTNAYVYGYSPYYLSFGVNIGSIQNTNAFESDLTEIVVVQKTGSRQDGVLYISKDNLNWVTYTAEEIEKGGYVYFKYAYETANSSYTAAMYSNIQSITYTLSGKDNCENVANYIMYEDTTNQCLSKLSNAINKLNSMSNADKSTFWNSDDYVILSARERIQAWALHESKELSLVNDAYIMSNAKPIISLISIGEDSSPIVIILIIALISVSVIGGYFFYKKRK